MKKKCFYSEVAYLLGIFVLAIGTAFMVLADFGVSMIVAPAYLLHLKLIHYLPFFSFGMAEYTLQAVLILMLAIVMRRFKLSYLFSFGTAVFYGFVLDGVSISINCLPTDAVALRIVYYVVGLLLCGAGVSLLFHTYISPEAYELFVKEISGRLHVNINRVKTIYDCASCVVAVVLSFLFFGFGKFEGINVGTVVCAVVNGLVIAKWSLLFERCFAFKDGLQLRKYFE